MHIKLLLKITVVHGIIMAFIEGCPAPKQIPGPRFLFQNSYSLKIGSIQVKFERKSIASSISIELPNF